MPIDEYPFGRAFQDRVMGILLQETNSVASVVKPQYFASPIDVDIARIVLEVHEKHPKEQLSRGMLLVLVRKYLGQRRADVWPIYRREIRRFHRLKVSDRSTVIEQAVGFAKDARYRDAVIKAEKLIYDRKYEAVHKVFDQLRISLNGQGDAAALTIDTIPAFDPDADLAVVPDQVDFSSD